MDLTVSLAVVARKVLYGEADLIVTLLSREHGKIAALARAARRSQRRFGGALELFTVSQVELRPRRAGRDLWTLGSAEIAESFPAIARDVAALAHGSYGTELARELCADDVPEPALFDLLVGLYRALSQRGARTDVLRAFELAALDVAGFAPMLEACAACGRRAGFELERGAVLDPSRGGVLCSSCAPASRGAGVRALSAGARALLVAAQRVPGGLAAVDLRADPSDAAEARDAMVALVHHHLGRPLKTLEFLDKMKAAPGDR